MKATIGIQAQGLKKNEAHCRTLVKLINIDVKNYSWKLQNKIMRTKMV